jgi:hypothetical protein
MPDWMLQLTGPIASGAVTGLMLVAGLKVEVKSLGEKFASLASSVQRAHVRIDDHIERHHIGRGNHA